MLQVFGPLLAGVPLLAVPPPLLLSPARLLNLLARERVTHLTLVPSFLRVLLPNLGLTAMRHAGGDGADTARGVLQGTSSASALHAAQTRRLAVRLLVCSGEALSVALLRRAVQALPDGCTVLNL